MSARLVAPSIDGPSPMLTRVAAQLARAEARETLRALVALASLSAGPLEQLLRDAERDAAGIPAEHRAAYLSARLEQFTRAHGMPRGQAAPAARRAAAGR